MRTKLLSAVIAVLVLGSAVVSGCYRQKGYSPEMVSPSGFLPQTVYMKMRDGDPEKLEPAKIYRDVPAIRAGQYDKVMLDPIVMYRNPYKEDPGVTPEDAQTLVNYFQAKLVEALKNAPHVSQVMKPEPRTVRISVAVTDMDASDVALDTVSTYIPQVRALATLGTMAREKPAFVGEIGVEFKAQDAQTGKLLAAGIDRRFGGKTFKAVSEWSDVKAIMDYYAALLTWRVCMLQGGPGADCDKYKP